MFSCPSLIVLSCAGWSKQCAGHSGQGVAPDMCPCSTRRSHAASRLLQPFPCPLLPLFQLHLPLPPAGACVPKGDCGHQGGAAGCPLRAGQPAAGAAVGRERAAGERTLCAVRTLGYGSSHELEAGRGRGGHRGGGVLWLPLQGGSRLSATATHPLPCTQHGLVSCKPYPIPCLP